MVLLNIVFYIAMLQLKYASTSASSNTGREFIVLFLEHVVDDSNLDIYVTTVQTTTVNVNISVPLSESDQSPITLTVTRGETAHTGIKTTVALEGTQKAGKGILIVSDEDVTVQCFSTSTSSNYKHSVGGYLAIPTRALGLEYMIIVFRVDNSNIFAIVATEDQTVVDIVVKLPSNKWIRFDGKKYYDGDTVTVSLDRYEAVEILSQHSPVGTMISASKNVAVFVGADMTSVKGDSMDHLLEQLAPLNTWGMDYMLIPTPDRSSFDVVVVTAQFDDTTVEMYGEQHTIAGAGSRVLLKLASDSPAYLWSDKRILVIQVSASHDEDSTDYSDPSMLAVPPMQQWLSEYSFASSMTDSDASDPVLILVSKTSCTSEVSERDDDDTVFNWIEIADTPFSFSYSAIPEGFYSVRITGNDGCKTFGGFLYGPGYNFAWSMPVGQTFKVLAEERVDTSSTELVEATSILETSSLLIDLSSSLASSSSIPVQESVSTVSPSSMEVLETSSLSSLDIELTTSIFETSSLVTTASISSLDIASTTSLQWSSMDIVESSSPVTTSSISSLDIASTTSIFETSFLKTSSIASILLSSNTDVETTADFTSHLDVSSTIESLQTTPSYESLNTEASYSVTDMQGIHYSSSTIQPTLVPASPTQNVCTCKCKTPTRSIEEIEEIHRQLIVNRSSLSSVKRSYYSVVDSRGSSLVIGTVGLAFICITLGLIASSDLFAVILYLHSLLKKK